MHQTQQVNNALAGIVVGSMHQGIVQHTARHAQDAARWAISRRCARVERREP